MAILAMREGLVFDTTIESDCASLWEPIEPLLNARIEIHCLRDLTRGGLSSGLIEIAETAQVGKSSEEKLVPIHEEKTGACELLGLDPLYLANEGRFVAFVPEHQTTHALDILSRHAVTREASRIGQVQGKPAGMVTIKSRFGTERVLDMLSGEQLPRIC